MAKTYLVKDTDGKFVFSNASLLDDPSGMGIVNHPIRARILTLLAEKPMYAAEIAKKLSMHEQKIYYHIKQLVNAGVLEVVDKKEIRGTVAKKYSPRSLNFAVSLGGPWKPLSHIYESTVDKKLYNFLSGFISDKELDAFFVVGSPDPHGEFKAYSRDGHYAVDLSLFFGSMASHKKDFSVMLDVDVRKDKVQANNLILVGGPVTNTVVAEINDLLPIKFSDTKPWGITSTRTSKSYTDDSIGLIARIPNPFDNEKSLLVLAGIRFIGTKAAVLALTRHHEQLLKTYSGQRSWAAIVQGFDLDGDGKIDSIEVLE